MSTEKVVLKCVRELVGFTSGKSNMSNAAASQTWHLIHACKSNGRSIIHLYKGTVFYWNENEVQMLWKI